MSKERIKKLEKQIVELKRRWPAHLVPPPMFRQLDELEGELEKAAGEKSSAKADGHGGL